ncbi:MAG: hypothetical protein IKY48_06265 [Bacteroidales bacterium]|nr:hypothetical protein [Bacteroidales bacterium]
MTENEKDILQDIKLKKNPYSVPEGYFDALKTQARKYAEPTKIVRVNFWTRLAPYAGIAAMFLFVLVLGKVFVNNSQDDLTAEQTESYEDFLVFSDISSDIPMQYLAEEVGSEEAIDYEDIIEYLIYIGATEEYIEYNRE